MGKLFKSSTLIGRTKPGRKAIDSVLPEPPKLMKPPPVAPLPDEEALDLARRRQRSRRRGSRASTVLTGGEDDTLG